VKKLWIDREFDEKEDPPSDQFIFIKSLPTDNPHNAQSYLEDLQRLPERLRKAYWDGSWDVFEGQYFTEWNRDKHVIKPFTNGIPLSWKKYRAYDHGRTNAACCLWGAVDEDGRLVIYRELYATLMDVDQLATEIKRLSDGEEYEFSVADPAIFANIGFTDKYGGQTIAETFARYGIMFLPASNRRVDGWNLMHQYLRYSDVLPPKLQFFETCKNVIREIPLALHDEKKPEDLDTSGSDHALDATRYMLMSLHETRSAKPLSEVEMKLKQFRERDMFSPQNLNTVYYP
jgi:hypothetical protein